MSQIAIQAENLSKSYIIDHQSHKASYATLRDTIACSVKQNWSRLCNPSRLTNKPNEEFWALKDISFNVKQGHRVGIIGRNGAGKSTLLKILSRITEPTTGRISIKGRVASLLEVGTGFHPELTGRENIFLNGAILGMSRREINLKFDEIVQFAEIEKFLDTPVKRYSSGMYVRLAFSVAAHLEPDILVIDEVLAVGDAQFQNKCVGKIKETGQEGRTVLFVSHNMNAVRNICHCAILLNNGAIVDYSDTSSIVDQYISTGIGSELSEIKWDRSDAPSCDELSLLSIRVLNEDKKVLSDYNATKPINIEITFFVKKPIEGMRTALRLFGSEGELAFISTNHRVLGDKKIETGEYVTICNIYNNLLNDGSYTINIQFDIPGKKFLIKGQEFLKFNVFGCEGHGSDYPQKWDGVLAPKLDWIFFTK